MTTQGQEDQDCNLMKVTGQAVAKVTVMDALLSPPSDRMEKESFKLVNSFVLQYCHHDHSCCSLPPEGYYLAQTVQDYNVKFYEFMESKFMSIRIKAGK